MDYKETIKERLKILPDSLRAFIMDENWRKDAEGISKRFGFDEEKYASFENEIFLVLLCFEPRKDFEENVKRELVIDSNIATRITEDVERNIFSRVAGELDAVERQVEESETENQEVIQPANGVGQSFEQIILNQAKAMQPAREAPSNLPTGEQQTKEPKVIHNYIENDPYREPAE